MASRTFATMYPVTPWSITSRTEPRSNASTGVAQAMASIMTRPNGSGQSMGKKKSRGLAQEPSFLAVVDLANEFDTGGVQKRCDAFPEIGLVGAIDFRGNFERHAGRAGDFNGTIDAFLRRDAAEEGEIV